MADLEKLHVFRQLSKTYNSTHFELVQPTTTSWTLDLNHLQTTLQPPTDVNQWLNVLIQKEHHQELERVHEINAKHLGIRIVHKFLKWGQSRFNPESPKDFYDGTPAIKMDFGQQLVFDRSLVRQVRKLTLKFFDVDEHFVLDGLYVGQSSLQRFGQFIRLTPIPPELIESVQMWKCLSSSTGQSKIMSQLTDIESNHSKLTDIPTSLPLNSQYLSRVQPTSKNMEFQPYQMYPNNDNLTNVKSFINNDSTSTDNAISSTDSVESSIMSQLTSNNNYNYNKLTDIISQTPTGIERSDLVPLIVDHIMQWPAFVELMNTNQPEFQRQLSPTYLQSLVTLVSSSNYLKHQMHGLPVEFLNHIYGMSIDFNWLNYCQLNPDLEHVKSYHDAVRHYTLEGRFQERPYKIIQNTLPDVIKQPSIDNIIPSNKDMTNTFENGRHYDISNILEIQQSKTNNVEPSTNYLESPINNGTLTTDNVKLLINNSEPSTDNIPTGYYLESPINNDTSTTDNVKLLTNNAEPSTDNSSTGFGSWIYSFWE